MSQPQENKVIIDGQIYYGGLNQPNLKFIKVNVDCWERIFDFLSLHDILTMSQTCQRMRQIGGHYYRENFHGTVCTFSESCFYLKDSWFKVGSHDFHRFIDTLQIIDNVEYLCTIASMGLLRSLTALHLQYIDLNEQELHGLLNMEMNIETIDLTYCSIGDNFVSEFISSCLKLRSLRFKWVKFKPIAVEDNFFHRIYPMLEHFEYIGTDGITQLMSFLERNPSIKCLQIEPRDLQDVPLNAASVQLDYLNIDIYRWSNNADELLNRLKMLHANGFFQKLCVSIKFSSNLFYSESFIREMISFNSLEVLSTYKFYTNAMNDWTHLKEWHLKYVADDVSLKTTVENLINLERLCICCSVNQLTSFICHSKKLKFVIFSDRTGDFNGLDLFNLNSVLQMNGIKRRVRIFFTEESQYLATKWKTNGMNYDLVEITRAETIRKHFHYGE